MPKAVEEYADNKLKDLVMDNEARISETTVPAKPR